MIRLVAYSAILLLPLSGLIARSQNTSWKVLCGNNQQRLKTCIVSKIENVSLGGVPGYVTQYKAKGMIAQWWIPSGTGTCWYKNTYFRGFGQEWIPVNAYCDGTSHVVVRRIDGPVVLVTGFGEKE